LNCHHTTVRHWIHKLAICISWRNSVGPTVENDHRASKTGREKVNLLAEAEGLE
jgi:hypothetical protein